MIQTKTSTSCLSLKQRSFLLLTMRLCLNNTENCSKTTEENLRSSNLLCFPDERKKQRRLKPRRWFAKNVFPDFDCISFFNQPWTVNQGRAVSFKRFTIPWNQCLGGCVVCCGDYGWTLPDAFQTYFIRWDVIDLPSPQIGAKTLFLVYFNCR